MKRSLEQLDAANPVEIKVVSHVNQFTQMIVEQMKKLMYLNP